jgi:hypothetical protein
VRCLRKDHFGWGVSVPRSETASRSKFGQSEIGHFFDPGDISTIRRSPRASCSVQVLEADDARQDQIVDSLYRNLIEKGFDMREPLCFRLGRGEAMNEALRVNWARARGVNRSEDRFDWAISFTRLLIGSQKLSAQSLDIADGLQRNLYFDTLDTAVRPLEGAICPDATGSGAIDHIDNMPVTGLRVKGDYP